MDVKIAHRNDESGGIVARKLDQHIAEQQRIHVSIDKQSRLFKSEQEQAAKISKDGDKGKLSLLLTSALTGAVKLLW